MKEFKVLESPRSLTLCEEVLNDLAEHGWNVVAITNYQIFLDREKQQLLTEDVVGGAQGTD